MATTKKTALTDAARRSLGDKETTPLLSYRVVYAPSDEPGFIVASFPDLPEAVCKAPGEAEAREMAGVALAQALRARLASQKPLLPIPPTARASCSPSTRW